MSRKQRRAAKKRRKPRDPAAQTPRQPENLTPDREFAIAVGHHQAGRLQEADGLYRKILQVQPKHPDSLHYLGVIAAPAGNLSETVDLIEKALCLRPCWPNHIWAYDFVQARTDSGATTYVC